MHGARARVRESRNATLQTQPRSGQLSGARDDRWPLSEPAAGTSADFSFGRLLPPAPVPSRTEGLMGAAPVQRARRLSYKGSGERPQVVHTFDFEYPDPEQPLKMEERERPFIVNFTVDTKAKSKSTPDPLSFYSPALGDYEDVGGYHRGHLMGYDLGGPGVSENIVPMLASFNTGPWKVWENESWAYARRFGRNNVECAITIAYGDEDPRVPTGFALIRNYRESQDGYWKTLDFRYLNHEVEEGMIDAERVEEIQDLSKLSKTDKLRGAAAENWSVGLSKLMKYIIGPWIEEDEDRSLETVAYTIWTTGHLPPFPGVLPADPAHRPYEEMDILNLAGELAISMPDGYAGGSEFSGNQIALIHEWNRARNGGKLRSDARNDPHQELTRNGTLNRPEVDHIVPISKGGSNLFSNARIVSWEMNNKLERITKNLTTSTEDDEGSKL